MTSRRELKSFACGMANKFICSANHYAWLAKQHKVSLVRINLLTLSIAPPEFDIERNRILAGQCRDHLMMNLQRHSLDRELDSAELVVDFEIDMPIMGKFGMYIATTVTVNLGDKQGKMWIGIQKTTNVLAQL